MNKVKRALISVSNKKGLIPFAKKLHQFDIEILSTGGTAKQLTQAGIPVKEVSAYTGFPEMMDGRLKTLHPKIHGGLLALRENKSHMDQVKKHKIDLIDMVVVNLYPFENVIKKKNVSLEEAIENIDIGGPTMLRAAAKNYKNVAVVCNPQKYRFILEELEANSGLLSDSVLYRLSIEAFGHCARYDSLITKYLSERLRSEDMTGFPEDLSMHFTKLQDLRYGENPHQLASFYRDTKKASGLSAIKQLHGKELSFNNILDLNAAVDFIKDFDEPAAVIIKHNNPTGLACHKSLATAFQEALSGDPVSAFGGIIGFNRTVDSSTAKAVLRSGFMECIIAPKFHADALKALKDKKNLRLIECDLKKIDRRSFDSKRVFGGMLVQDSDVAKLEQRELKVVTKKKPTKQQVQSMLFGWKVIKNVKSNAIVLVKGRKTLGIGCGQTSRVDSVKIAIDKAQKAAKGSVLISDAFFPKTDNIQLAAKAGIAAIIQPGGSIADQSVIKAADRHKMAMVFTGKRHFKH